MSDTIQFNCPACSTTLRIPTAAAGSRGPCPKCGEEITAPSPQAETTTIEEPLPEIPEIKESPEPPATTPPKAPMSEEIVASPVVEVPTIAPTGVSRNAPHWVILVLCCLLTGIVGVGLGFTFGVYSTKLFDTANVSSWVPKLPTKPTPPPETEAENTPILVEPVEGAPLPEPPPPVPEPLEIPSSPEEPAATEEPVPRATKVSDAAEASLRAFLEAPDWAARSAHILYPEKFTTAMEAYSREVADGPTAFKSLKVLQSQIDEETGNTLFIFSVATEKFPEGIPTAVKETASGWLVDWPTFVEFRDGLFQEFVDGPVDQPRLFHLVVTAPDAGADGTANPNFESYQLLSPLIGKKQLAFVKKGTPTAGRIGDRVAEGRIYTPVLEVVKRLAPDKREFFEILSVEADDWFPRDP